MVHDCDIVGIVRDVGAIAGVGARSWRAATRSGRCWTSRCAGEKGVEAAPWDAGNGRLFTETKSQSCHGVNMRRGGSLNRSIYGRWTLRFSAGR